LHALAPHTYLPHILVAPSHVPVPLHLPTSVSTPPVHEFVPHDTDVLAYVQFTRSVVPTQLLPHVPEGEHAGLVPCAAPMTG
jgi:hypothetical protein